MAISMGKDQLILIAGGKHLLQQGASSGKIEEKTYKPDVNY